MKFDLNFFTQIIFTLFFLSIGLFYFLKATAAKYFDVSGGFVTDHRRDLMVSDSSDCFVCDKPSTKKCSRCKSVRYCSADCQKSDWDSGHKSRCKSLQVTNSSSSPVPRDSFGFKASLFENRPASKITLVTQLSQSKATVKPGDVLFPYETFVEYFNWDKPTLAPCGLINCGNSCYANVVLQCLSWTRPLVAYVLERGHKRECRRNDWCFFCEFETHLERANQSHFPFSPMNIISRLPNIGGNLGYGRQEDAHELMRFAIDMMQSVCLEEFGGEKAVPPLAQETTLIQYIFGGLLQSQVQCTVCSNVSGQHENMMDLTVEIHGDAVSLEECLDQFTAKEWLHGDNLYKCDKCNDYVKACKRLSIRSAPNILTIALKRFQGGRFGKLNKRISFPETFDLGPYMSGEGEGTDVYKLYAVIVHLDMLNASFFGHYICYVKDFRGNWYRIDDSEVEKVELEDVLSQRAYMLLYSRVQTRPSSLRSEEDKDEKKTDTLNTEPNNQDDSTESSEVGANITSVNSLCNGNIAHSVDTESPLPQSVNVSEEGNEFATTVDTVDYEPKPSIEIQHDHRREVEEEANGEEDPTVVVDSDRTTSSPPAATEFKLSEKEDSDTEMIDVQ